MIKSVRSYKTLKTELYKWTQIVKIVTHGVFIFSTFFLLISLMQYIFNSPPTFIVLSVISPDAKMKLLPND